MSCSRTQRNDAGEARTRDPSVSSQALYYTLNLCLIKVYNGPGPKVIKLFSYSTQLSTKFILLLNVKMTTIVRILTFISIIKTTSERLKGRNFFICRYFSLYEQLKSCSVELNTKSFITSGPVVRLDGIFL